MKRNVLWMLAASGALAVGASGAQAHALHGAAGLAGGLVHPFLGLDHLLAMVAVGLWAGQLGRQAVWQVPLGFVFVMVAAFGLARLGWSPPLAEPMVVASVAVLGAMVAGAVRVPAAVGMALVSLFAVFHGLAHGIEMPTGSSAAAYAVGFALTTLGLHGLGLGLGRALRQRPVLARLGGAAIAATGVALMGGL